MTVSSRRTAALMLQGTGSDVGKSLLTAGLARAFTRRGLRVAPFKPQNMSNNAAACPDQSASGGPPGGEIGRAQALQARAARRIPTVDMNPVLLKPQSDTGAQVVVRGRALTQAEARDYQALKPRLLAAVLDSFARLEADADLVLVEGAGSPAEINLRRGDIANMGFAGRAEVPVVLVGDIDRGGVIAALCGTHAVLEPEDRQWIRGFLINKFRGDLRLFDDGVTAIETRTGWPGFGVVPWFGGAHLLPAEDAVQLEQPVVQPHGPAGRQTRIVVPMLSRIANFDDLDPLRTEAHDHGAVSVRFIPPGQPLPRDADAILLPGSKASLADLAFMRRQGWDIDILAHHRQGRPVLGLCGGYQLLGRSIADPDGLEGPPGSAPGLGLLAIDTVLTGRKTVRPVAGTAHLPGMAAADGIPVHGYEIHMGRSAGPDCARPFVTLADGQPDGAWSADGLAGGTYLHGIFAADGFRTRFLDWLGGGNHGGGIHPVAYEARVERLLDDLADHLERHADLDGLLALACSRCGD